MFLTVDVGTVLEVAPLKGAGEFYQENGLLTRFSAKKERCGEQSLRPGFFWQENGLIACFFLKWVL